MDAVRFDTRELYQYGSIKLLGNLPYSAGGAILANFLSRPIIVDCAVIMLQKEFIDRMVATPKTKDYGILTLRTQVDWTVNPVKTVGPEAFFPKPLIDSTVVRIDPTKTHHPPFDYKLFDSLIRRGFAQRRKMLRKAMPENPEWEKVCTQLSITETCRAEELPLNTWIELSRIYDQHPLKDKAQDPNELLDLSLIHI